MPNFHPLIFLILRDGVYTLILFLANISIPPFYYLYTFLADIRSLVQSDPAFDPGYIFLVHAGLSLYFNTSLSLAGADIFSFSKNHVVQTVGPSGDLNAISTGAIILLIAVIVSALQRLTKCL
jgi:hypothetical protein